MKSIHDKPHALDKFVEDDIKDFDATNDKLFKMFQVLDTMLDVKNKFYDFEKFFTICKNRYRIKLMEIHKIISKRVVMPIHKIDSEHSHYSTRLEEIRSRMNKKEFYGLKFTSDELKELNILYKEANKYKAIVDILHYDEQICELRKFTE
jgi:hypothetical protein